MMRIAWMTLTLAALGAVGGCKDEGKDTDPADDTTPTDDTTDDTEDDSAVDTFTGPEWAGFSTFALFGYEFATDSARSYNTDAESTTNPTMGFILLSADLLDGRATDEYCFVFISGPETLARADWATADNGHYFGVNFDLTDPTVSSNCDDLFGEEFTASFVADFVQQGEWGAAVSTDFDTETTDGLEAQQEDAADYTPGRFRSTIPNLPEEFYGGYVVTNEVDESWTLQTDAGGDPLAIPAADVVVPAMTPEDTDAMDSDMPVEVPEHLTDAVYDVEMAFTWVFQ